MLALLSKDKKPNRRNSDLIPSPFWGGLKNLGLLLGKPLVFAGGGLLVVLETITRGYKIALILLVLTFATPAHAETQAENTIRTFYSQLSTTMKQGDQLGFAGRYKKLDPAIRSAFNLPLMAQLSVGSSWTGASPQEQKELVDAFAEFSVASYANRFAGDEGETFAVTGEKSGTDGSVTVETTLQPKTGDAVEFNYLMRPDAKGKYRIVDVFINGTISELATRRAEFSSIARRDGIGALVNSLDQKSKEMGPS